MVKNRFAAVALVLLSAHVSGAEYVLKLAGGIEISAREDRFDRSRHSLSGCGQAQQVCQIDGSVAYGSASAPKSELSKIVVRIGSEIYELDSRGMYDPLLGPELSRNFGGFCYDPKNCAFRAVLGDAGGIYSAEWVIKSGKVFRTTLTDSADVYQFFKGHLAPPQYN